MRPKLKWKVAGAYATLIALTALGLDIWAERAVSASMTARMRASLRTECGLVRAVIEGKPEDELQEAVSRLAHRTRARITLIRHDGVVVADSEAPPAEMVLHDTRIEIVRARESGWSSSMRPSATLGTDMLYVAQAPSADALVVRLALPLTEVRQASAELRRSIFSTALLATAIAILAATWLAGGITRSLDELSEAAEKMGRGDLTARARPEAKDETAQVADAMNHMAQRLSHAQAELQRSAAHLSSVLSQMLDGVVVVGADEAVQLLNPAAALLLETDGGTAIGRSLAEVCLNYELVEMVHRTLRLNTRVEGEIRTGHREDAHVAAAAAPIRDEADDLVGAVVTLTDITELKHLQLVRQDFVANAGHELRTPVAAIRSLAEALQGGALQDENVAPRFLAQIVENTEGMARLIEDMMALSRLESADPRQEPQRVSVPSLISDAIARTEPQAKDKGIRISQQVAADCLVWTDRDGLMAALVNLIDNAVKYTPTGGQVIVATQARGNDTRITVSDTGPGIPEKDRERVFERFYRVDQARSRAVGGTGLGLSIVKHAVEAGGGKVWAQAAPEGGAQFVVDLPSAPPRGDLLMLP